jgi:hypothetical protein
MMGGELSDDGKMRAGFKDIYSSRSFRESTATTTVLKERVTPVEMSKASVASSGTAAINNPLQTLEVNVTGGSSIMGRPMPGIKSIDVQFKGGVRALRTANISWTCWSFEDLDRLMPHFLAHGKTVALEWGWVYNKKQFSSLQTLINKKGKIDENGFKDYREKINKTKGDFDFMVGVVKNFEYTTRDDGGFDCKTDIVSTGVNILNANSEGDDSGTKLQLYNIKEDDTVDEKIKKLNALLDDDTGLENIFYDSKLSFSMFMARFSYWMNNYYGQFGDGTEDAIGTGASTYRGRKKSFIITNAPSTIMVKPRTWEENTYTSKRGYTEVEDFDVWVRWGWFEDNILNKFFALVTEPTGEIVNEFRSVNRIVENDKDGIPIPINKFESTIIRNHRFLETANYNKFILPGQFTTADQDPKRARDLETFVKTNFDSFAVPDSNKRKGYFRNILFNAKFLQECFNFTDNTDLKTGMENLFNGMNVGISNFWSFQIETDAIESNRLQIIDENQTYYDWSGNLNQKFEPLERRSTFDVNTGELNVISKDEGGVFHFPVWKSNSIVKNQSVTAKLPNSMQLAAMYGANIDLFTNLHGSDDSLSSKGKVAGTLAKDSKDVYKSGIDMAFRHEHSPEGVVIALGREKGSEDEPLSITEGPSLGAGFPGTADAFEGIKTVITADIFTKIEELSDTKIPENGNKTTTDELDFEGMLPTPAAFSAPEEFANFIKALQNAALPDRTVHIVTFRDKNYKFDTIDEINKILKYYKTKYTAEGKLKTGFLDSMAQFVTFYGETKANNVPVLIPLELELRIDGIGGIYPGNSFHSDYLPTIYKDETIFQCFDINHTVDSSGWTVSLNGKMRASLSGLYARVYSDDEKVVELLIKTFNELASFDRVFPNKKPGFNSTLTAEQKKALAKANKERAKIFIVALKDKANGFVKPDTWTGPLFKTNDKKVEDALNAAGYQKVFRYYIEHLTGNVYAAQAIGDLKIGTLLLTIP